jgi:hypothetical protein
MYIISITYGAYAMREFLGREIFEATLGDDPAHWPTAAFIQLPSIPFSLILQRTSLASSFPLLPISLAFLAFPVRYTLPFRVSSRITLDSSINGQRQPLLHPPGGLWPPSPYIVAALFPIIRYAYRWAYRYVARKLLMHTSLVEAARQLDAGTRGTELIVHVERDNQHQLHDGQGAQVPANEPPAGAQAAANAEAAGPGRRWRVSDRSFGRMIGGALLIPRIASFMGNLLLRLSRHSSLLRIILAARPNKSPGVDGTSFGLGAAVTGALGVWGKGRTPWANDRLWTLHDPVWWRNALGLGLFVVVSSHPTFRHVLVNTDSFVGKGCGEALAFVACEAGT